MGTNRERARDEARYRSRPVEIDAMRYTGNNAYDVIAWVAGIDSWDEADNIENFGGAARFAETGTDLVIVTLEGEMTCRVGDWVIKGTVGEFYPCKPHVFAQKYQPA